MVCLVTAHSTKPGQEDYYEAFLQQRKLWFVRNLPGITNYKVYRTEKYFPPTEDDKAVRYTIMAVIEYDGEVEQLLELYSSKEWMEFMEEYMDLLEEDPALYIAHEIPETGHLSKEAFITGFGQP